MASLARLIPWWILQSSPATSWYGDRVLVAVALNLLDSRPEMVLKLELRRDILLLSLGLFELIFLGLEQTPFCWFAETR